jgi:sporulation protein YlmC with PRC-barrel domain
LPAEAASVTDYYRQNVYDTAGQKISEIVDILLEKQGQVSATMISVGSFSL